MPEPRVTRRFFVLALGPGSAVSLSSVLLGCDGTALSPDAGSSPAMALRYLTPVDEMFRQFGGRTTVADWALPQLDGESHRLAIEGLVARPQALSLGDLKAEISAHVTVVNTMMCVLGFRGTAVWTGVPLRLLLDRAQVDRERARRLRFVGADGFHNNLKLSDIYNSPPDLFDPLIAFAIYGQPLPRELGFPFRLLLGDRYGYKNTKFLARIEVTDSDEPTGQYQESGYDDAGVIETVPTVESHRIRDEVQSGRLELSGIALSGSGGVAAVEVSVDGGPYESAELSQFEDRAQHEPRLRQTLQYREPQRFGAPLRGVWRLWRFALELEPGLHTVAVQALDTNGQRAEGTDLQLTVR